jgi:hypothetical protein
MKRAAVPSILVAVVLLAVAVIAEAQQQAKTFKVGWLESATTDRGSGLGDIFLRRLAELGFVEGKNIASSIAPLITSWTGFPPWWMNSYVSTSMCCSRARHRQP